MNIGYEKNFYDLMLNNEMNDYHIYFLVLDGVVIYVGQTKNVFGRLAEYKCRFLKKNCHNQKLQEMFDDGRIKRVVFLIKDKSSTKSDAIRLEKHYIKEHRNTCFNEYDTFFSPYTRKKIGIASKQTWENEDIRNRIIKKLSKKHILTSPVGIVYEFDNSYDIRKFLEKENKSLHKNDKNRVGYQMLESTGENKGWKLKIEGKRLPSHQLNGTLKTPIGEMILINGKSTLVNINRNRNFRMNINQLIKNGKYNEFVFNKN